MEQSDIEIAPKTKKNINLVYKHTHKDFKSIRDGVKYCMWYDNGTVSGPIEDMPDDLWHIRLRSSKKKEEKETV